MIFCRKNARKDDIYSITKIYDICVLLMGKLKMIKNFNEKVAMIFCAFMETFIAVFIHCFSMK